MVPSTPLPLPPETIDSHPALLTAVHSHSAPLVVRSNPPLPPARPKEAASLEIEVTAHPSPGWNTEKVALPAVIVAVREVDPSFAATE